VTATEPRAATTAEFFARLPGWEGAEDDIFAEPEEQDASEHPLRAVLEWLAVVIGALTAALLIKVFLFQAFFIPSESMVPTLEVGDRVLVNKLAYSIGDVERGDIIVFDKPDSLPDTGIDEFIKRVVGVAGDTLVSRDGVVFVNGEPLDESYLPEGTPTDGLDEITIPEGYVFVMGDNRTNSQDSRVFGPVPVDDIVGEAFLRVWPVPSVGGL
jgi:signal peptidase I